MSTALIVDDSALARHVLGRLLEKHGLEAESADSAESALEFLKHRRPDVIFMDHMMPGMDGFQALEAIKANPATATIPVMMYTSQQGELYVGQARALGAFGVLPKDLKPVEVARVLKALRLIPGDRDADRPGAPPQAPPERADGQRVRELLEELFRQQRAALREEIRQSYERALAATPPLTTPPPETVATPSRTRSNAMPALVGALALAALAFGYLYFNAARLVDELTAHVAQLTNNARENSLVDAVNDARPASPANDTPLLEAVEWAVNLDATYGFGEVPLDDTRAEKLGRLIELLGRARFRGRVLVNVHVGRFCMSVEAAGANELAAADLPATDCAQVGWAPTEAFALGRRQTLAFANRVAAAGSAAGIEIETVSLGSDQPLFDYPPLGAGGTAEEWNAVAARNHRIEIRLLPQAGAAANTGN